MYSRLNKFERVRIIGYRAEQLAMGAQPMVNIDGMDDALEIAEKEFEENVIPFIIQRNYPNNIVTKTPIKELKK